MNTARAEAFFSTVTNETVARYVGYWNSIRPETMEDFFRRYLFAFTSVHTTWEGNIRGYNAIKDLGWVSDKENLRERLRNSGCGMHNARAEFIWNFKDEFFGNLNRFCTVKGDWATYRNRLVKDIKGLGIAKVSFTLEMCFPAEAEITCIDTHGVQLYELPQNGFQNKKGVEMYEEAERHWVENSFAVGAPPTIARAIYWDRKQNQPDSRYWTYVLES